jgi:hypothetical protein
MRENGVALMPYHCADGWIYEAHLESGDGRMTTAPDPWRPARDVTGIPMETTRRLAVVGEGQARLAPYGHERRRSTVDRH